MSGNEVFSSSGRGRTIPADGESPPIDRVVEVGPLKAAVRADRTVSLYSPGGYRLRDFTQAEWAAFVRGVRDGEFDDLAESDEAWHERAEREEEAEHG